MDYAEAGAGAGTCTGASAGAGYSVHSSLHPLPYYVVRGAETANIGGGSGAGVGAGSVLASLQSSLGPSKSGRYHPQQHQHIQQNQWSSVATTASALAAAAPSTSSGIASSLPATTAAEKEVTHYIP